MKILFDQGTPAPLRRALIRHAVVTAYEIGWAEFDNGRLLAAAEREFDVLVTTDKNLRHQQRMTERRLAIFVLPTTNWLLLQQYQSEIAAAIDSLSPGETIEIKI